MSELRVAEIHNPNDQTGGIEIDNDDNVSIARLQSLNGGQLGGFRNNIINGDFRVWQRGTSGFTNTTGSPIYGSADRWRLGASTTATLALASNLGPAGFANSASLAAGVGVQQRFESNNLHFRNGETVTASVWATGVPTISFVDSTNAVFVNAVGVSTGEVSNGFTRYALTWTFTSTPTGTFTALGITNGNATFFNFTGVQLELGPVATPFEHRPIDTELALCQRYYQTYSGNFLATTYTTVSDFIIQKFFPVEMRAAPTFTTGSLVNWANTASDTTTKSFSINGKAVTGDQPVYVTAPVFDAEL